MHFGIGTASFWKLQYAICKCVMLIVKRSKIDSTYPRVFAPEIWSENVDEAVRCLSAASFGPRDVFASNLGSGQMSGSPSFGYFSWKQKKVTALRHEQLVAKATLYSTRPPTLTLSRKGRGNQADPPIE